MHLISTHSINTLVADTQGQPLISASDEWAGGTEGGGWTPIKGLLWDCYQWGTSGNICHMAIYHQMTREAAVGNDGLSCEACVAVGRSAPFEFFITVLCHYMIKMIVGQVSTHSPPVINLWFSVMIRECGDGFLESVSVCCTTTSYLISAEHGSYSREANIFNKIETYQSSEQKSHLKYETNLQKCCAVVFKRRALSCGRQKGHSVFPLISEQTETLLLEAKSRKKVAKFKK